MFNRRNKRAPLRVCDYPDCLERATCDILIEGRQGYACKMHESAVARILSKDVETRGEV